MLAVLFGHVGARHQSDSSSRYACSPFSCGELRNVSLPLRRQGDPDYCGVPSYELACSDTKATIQINNGTYYVTGINYTSSSFRVIDSSLNMHSRCPPLPRSDQFPYPYGLKRQKYSDSESVDLFVPSHEVAWASFLNCSEAVGNNSGTYRTVDCLRTSNSDVYVVTAREPFCVKDLEASCGYLALIPYGGVGGQMTPVNVSFEDIVRFMRDGFTVKFPSYDHVQTPWQLFIEDVRQIIRQIRYDQTKDRIVDVLMFDRYVLGYMFREYYGERFPYDAVATALYSVRWIFGT
ncbi:hypothetical protein HU200_020928 [Digitaria exilis]|uniref:Wall-associated receptor kinase galacturonan-binding domain-containing protein n=1 Tax=Digitaria exilis TaxID=1010633 RepID=A0A835KER6_9POAL|nr:hypothetical protein HU200_020928 [Digitaria exilis]